MIHKLTKKVRGWINADHKDCGPLQMAGHFVDAYGAVGNTGIASVMAAVPCAKQTAKMLINKYKTRIGKSAN